MWLDGALSLLLALTVLVVGFSSGRVRRRARHLRGRTLRRQRRAREPGRIRWGSELLPRSAETQHFLVLGTTGSGKTVTIRRMMRDFYAAKARNERALVYDAKGDALPFLESAACSGYRTLDPFDPKGVAWDVARDISGPVAARQLARILIPDEPGGANPFFVLGARDILAELVQALSARRPNEWTLSDLLEASRSSLKLEEHLSATLRSRELFESYFGDARTGSNLASTLRSRLAELEPVAELWARKSERISLDSWLKGSGTLVIASRDDVRAGLDVLNRLVLQRASDLVLSQRESRVQRTWLFLDEVREAGRLDMLPSLLTRGRSKGVAVVLGLQDVEGLRELYGAHAANELLGMCSNKAVLRLESPETAEWASKALGGYERVEFRETRGLGWSSGARSLSEHVVSGELVLPAELMALPVVCGSRPQVAGFYAASSIGVYRASFPLEP